MTDDTNAIVFCGSGKPLEEKNYKIPEKLGEHEAIVKISISTVCGSDVHTWFGHRPFQHLALWVMKWLEKLLN